MKMLFQRVKNQNEHRYIHHNQQFFRQISAKNSAKRKLEAFELIMALAMSHAYGGCNPKQWADYLGIQPQKIYAEIQKWS